MHRRTLTFGLIDKSLDSHNDIILDSYTYTQVYGLSSCLERQRSTYSSKPVLYTRMAQRVLEWEEEPNYSERVEASSKLANKAFVLHPFEGGFRENRTCVQFSFHITTMCHVIVTRPNI